MAGKESKLKNLKTPTADEARRLGRNGGIKSGQVRKERKLLSQIYADLLAKGFEVDGERLSLDEVTGAILSRRDAAAVSMLKEIREATEGSRAVIDNKLEIKHTFDPDGV